MNLHLFLAILGFNIRGAVSFIGYDCNQKYSNFTSFSLVDIADCDLPSPIVNETSTDISLIQVNEFSHTPVFYCKVVIKRSAENCGAFSHVSPIKHGEIKYIHSISREECFRMHRKGSFFIANHYIGNLRVNDSVTTPLTFAGTLGESGDCTNGEYSDPYGHFPKALVRGYVSITLLQKYNAIDLETNKIILESGQRCTFSDEECTDTVHGDVFWNSVPINACEPSRYTTLYSGRATKIVERDSQRSPLYVVESDGIAFAFKDYGRVNKCTFELTRTEHPKLFILTDIHREQFKTSKHKTIKNLDIFSYVNSKFIYIEKHLKKHMQQLYQDVLVHQCELEKKVILNALNLASVNPELLAYYIMQAPGFVSLLAGEVIYILQCMRVEVTTRETDECYQELPVLLDEKPLFLAPRTHILREFGTKTACNARMPVMYNFGNRWVKLIPQITSEINPGILRPKVKQTWNYRSPLDLASSGIYNYGDVENLKTFIMFPNERQAVLNELTRGIIENGGITIGNASFSSFFDNLSLSKFAETTWNKLWNKFITFGSMCSGIITIILFIQLLKITINNLCQGNFFVNIYDWSLQILGAVGSTFTHLLRQLTRKSERSKQIKKNKKRGKKNGTRTQRSSSSSLSSVFWPSPNREKPKTLDIKTNSQTVLYQISEVRPNPESSKKFRSHPSLIDTETPSLPPRNSQLSRQASLV